MHFSQHALNGLFFPGLTVEVQDLTASTDGCQSGAETGVQGQTGTLHDPDRVPIPNPAPIRYVL